VSVTLILGGARSGKSGRAQQLAVASGLPVTYIATAMRIEGDEEWGQRIERHRAERPQQWQTVEADAALMRILQQQCRPGQLVLIDCLTLWLSGLLMQEVDVEREIASLAALLPRLPGEFVLVSNEVGMGLVPESLLGRRFRDLQGRLNQAVARVADRVEFVAAGLPLLLKGQAGSMDSKGE